MGRRAQLSLFAQNLAKDPESDNDPADFLFHVRGVGGVGKSTLLRQWQETARQTGSVTAVVDENDVHGVPQALAELARQLAEQAGPLKEFDRASEQYRREQEAAAQPAPAGGSAAEGQASVPARLAAGVVLGGVAAVAPGAAMVNPDALAQGAERLIGGAQARRQRGRRGDAAEVSRAFVADLGRLCRQHGWVVLCFDTWEQTGRYLDGWLRELLEDGFGPLPLNVIVVLAGRDELTEREWAPLRAQVADVPLEVFTEAETRALLAARGVTEPGVVDAVLQLSMGLPLLVELLSLARPGIAEDVDADGDVVDRAVERFVQWITDPRQRETVVACALAPQLNEDVFAAAAPEGAGELWGWLCGQPFVSGRGGFKQYHAVVRASMVRQQRTRSPQRWAAAHLRLADTHAAWRADVEEGLPGPKRWDDPRWLRHRLDETYHRLCANPPAQLEAALEQAVHASGQDPAILRQWADVLALAARDTADPALLSWAERLQNAAAGEEPALTSLTALLTHGALGTSARGWAHTYRGGHLYLADRDDEALAELDRATATDPGNARAWAARGELHRWHGRTDQAVGDLTTSLDLMPDDAWTLSRRGDAHRLAGHYDEAVADLTAAIGLAPDDAWAFAQRGETHRNAGRFDEAIADLDAALALDASLSWALARRGQAHRQAGHHDRSLADLDAALALDPTDAWALGQRGETHRLAGHLDEAIADFTAAFELDASIDWLLGNRGLAHRLAGRYEEAVHDLDAAVALNPDSAWALSERGETHRLAGRHDQAIADFTAALLLEPTRAWALGSRGQTHYDADRYEEAVVDLTAAIELDSTYDWAYAVRGASHRLVGHYELAVADFTAAIALNPANEWAMALRGASHRHYGHYELAVTDLDAALEINPDYAWALAQRGETHRQAGRPDQAVADFTRALELSPSYDWSLKQRGVVRRAAGDFALAREDLEAAVAADPDDRSYVFDKLMLDTLTEGIAVCREQWAELLASPTEAPQADATRFFPLFRVLFLEPDTDVTEATETFLADGPDPDARTDLRLYLAELSALDGELADRARHCGRLITEHTSE